MLSDTGNHQVEKCFALLESVSRLKYPHFCIVGYQCIIGIFIIKLLYLQDDWQGLRLDRKLRQLNIL